MIMFAAIMLLIIAVAILGYCVRHLQDSNKKLKATVKHQSDTIAWITTLKSALAMDCMHLDKTVADLQWQLDSSHFMLETVINELPDHHSIKIPNPRSDDRKALAQRILQEINTPESVASFPSIQLPTQRLGNGEAHFRRPA